MFERPKSGERAILVRSDHDILAAEERLLEFRELAVSAGALPVACVTGSRKKPDPRYFVGQGKAEEIAALVSAEAIELVLFDHALSPSQERNLEKLFQCRVLDRTSLILDIFAQRARSFEGKLQVELAQLRHLSTRLVRGWTHLERQKGGIGLRGPGETQLETDRRLLAQRIKQIVRRLEDVGRQREQGRAARLKANVPAVALVGYTNAGKSTLFNALTNAGALVADQLFATLDPTARRVQLPRGIEFVLIDTVGFIRDIPHELVEAFKATLQETRDADLLLHVVDCSDEAQAMHRHEVERVLAEIGADQVPQLLVANKIDKSGLEPSVELDVHEQAVQVSLSAHSGMGMELLLGVLQNRLEGARVHGWLLLQAHEGKLRGRLFAENAVVDEQITDEGGWLLALDMRQSDWNRLAAHAQLGARLLSQNPFCLATATLAQYNSPLA